MIFPKIKHCKVCKGIFSPVWEEQVECIDCTPLRCDPIKLELMRGITRKVWRQAA